MTDEKPSKFVDLPRDSFPFVAEFYRSDNGEVVHTVTVEGPGVMDVPPLGKIHGVEIKIRVHFPDGEIVRDGTQEDN